MANVIEKNGTVVKVSLSDDELELALHNNNTADAHLEEGEKRIYFDSAERQKKTTTESLHLLRFKPKMLKKNKCWKKCVTTKNTLQLPTVYEFYIYLHIF